MARTLNVLKLTLVNRINEWMKGKEEKGKFMNAIRTAWTMGMLYVELDRRGRTPTTGRVIAMAARVLVRETARKIPGYKRLESTATNVKRAVVRKYRNLKWRYEDSKFNFWLHTTAKRNLFSLFGLIQTVDVYELDYCYGGPEEGGWYYTAYTLLESHKCFSWNAQALKEKLEPQFVDEDTKKYGYTSVLAGHDYQVAYVDWKGQLETKGRPHYE